MDTELSVGLAKAISVFNSDYIKYTENHELFTGWMRKSVIQSVKDNLFFNKLYEGYL